MFRQHALRLTAIAVFATGLALAAGCGDDDDGPTGPGGGGGPDVTISIVGNLGSSSYSPSPDTVTVGQTVSWRNNDSMAHTATADGSSWDTGNIGAGGLSSPIAMNTAGSFPYHCTLHGLSMAGILVVEP